MLNIEAFSGGYDKNYSYLIWCTETAEAALVDPATDPGPIQKIIAEQRLQLDKILITHTHPDHLASYSQWLEQFPSIGIYGTVPTDKPTGHYKQLADKATILVGNQVLQMLHTPGHYPDCVCWYVPSNQAIFTGDTIFIGRPGRVIGAHSDIRQLFESIYERIFALPESTRVYPGHDYGTSSTATLAELRATYPFFACKNMDEFVSRMAAYEESRKIILQ